MNIQDLISRNLIVQTSNQAGIESNKINTFYTGFDPTANSLHVGHLLPLITMKRLKLLGANPIAIIGGATARVGDPTGRVTTRPILSQEDLDSNINNISSQIKSIVDCDIINNKGFVQANFIDFVADIGKHFSVNTMLKTDTFKTKLEHGLSFLEFSYSLLQANDFLQLSRSNNCFVQMGGNDQWANMIAGIHLIHAKDKKEAFAFTLPILEDKHGNKFGKSNGNAIWLDKSKTSVFDFWQFWRNVSDEDVKKLFMFFTFMSVEEINNLDFTDINVCKAKLATLVTEIVHGAEEAKSAEDKAKELFANQGANLGEAIQVESGKLLSEIMKEIGATSSRSEALRLIKNGGVRVDGAKILVDYVPNQEFIFLEKGKKDKFKVKIG